MKVIDKIINKKRYRAYREVFNLDDPHVQLVLKDMCKAHGVFNGGFDPDPYLNAFSSGEQNVLLRVFTILNMNPMDIVNLAEKEEE